jgi:cytochrome oxidase Cu insertion factor (SCO1/SenC/PrrC family)
MAAGIESAASCHGKGQEIDMRLRTIARGGLLGAAIVLATTVVTTSPASARTPNFGCYYQNYNIAAGETVILTDGDGHSIGFASCNQSGQLFVYLF